MDLYLFHSLSRYPAQRFADNFYYLTTSRDFKVEKAGEDISVKVCGITPGEIKGTGKAFRCQHLQQMYISKYTQEQ